MREPAPFPGSAAAQDAGCKCPVLDNGHGDPSLARARGGWVIVDICPLHGTGIPVVSPDSGDEDGS